MAMVSKPEPASIGMINQIDIGKDFTTLAKFMFDNSCEGLEMMLKRIKEEMKRPVAEALSLLLRLAAKNQRIDINEEARGGEVYVNVD